MRFDPEKYRQMLDPETRLMCDMLSPGFEPLIFKPEQQLSLHNPERLLKVLKIHRLYPQFYRVWIDTGAQFANPHWLHFTTAIKQLVDQNKLQMLQKTATLVSLTKTFENKGIPIIALKGPALAQRIYGDVAMRYSWDLDFLVPPEYLEKANNLLYSLNWKNTYTDKLFTPKQKQFCLNHYQHFIYNKPGFTGNIEIHWQLPQLNPFLTTNIQAFNNTGTVELGGNTIHVLNPVHEIYYLSAHGAFHSFYRLSWLYDITQMINKYGFDNNALLLSENKPLKRLTETVGQFSQIVFHKQYNHDAPINNGFILHCLKTINSIKGKNYKPSILREYWGKILLTSKKFLHIATIKPLLTSPHDWNTLPLPDSLFFLYFLLRPVLIMWRAIRSH